MRYNRAGQIARDHRGAAVAHWLNDATELFQQPVDATNPGGPWHLVTRTGGAVSEFRPDGANFLAARDGSWVRRLDGASPPCVGSAAWIPGDGRVGDVDHDGPVLVISDDGLTMWVDSRPFYRTSVQGPTRLIHGLLCWVSSGAVRVYDTVADRVVPVRQVGPGAAWPVAFRVNGRVWVAYGTDAMGGVLHPADDASQGYRFGRPMRVYNPEPFVDGVGGWIGWSEDEGEFSNLRFTVSEFGVSMGDLVPPMPAVVAPILTDVPLVGAFFTDDTTPGNVSVWVRGPLSATQAIIAPPELADQVPTDRLLGLWVAASPSAGLDSQIAAARPVAERLRVPMMVYDDQRTYRRDQIAVWCGNTPWLALPQCYIAAGESLDAFAADIARQVAALPVPYLPVVRAYTSWNGTDDTVPAAQVAAGLNALAPVFTHALGWLLFAWNRADGVTGRPALRPYVDAWLGVTASLQPSGARAWAAQWFPAVNEWLPLITKLYRELLSRDPDPYGIAYYTERLADGRMDEALMRADIMGSKEYKEKHPEPPKPPAIKTGREGYIQAAEEATAALETAPAPTLTIVGRSFMDRGALYIPRWKSALSILSKSASKQGVFLDTALAAGFNGVRVFAGALTWAGQTPSAALAALPSLLDRATTRGLAVEVTALTDTGTGYDVEAHLTAVADIVKGRRNVVLELANEVGHPTQVDTLTADLLRSYGQSIAEPRGILWAVGAASVDEPINGRYPTSGGRYSTAHLDRGRPTWNNVRRVRELYAIVEAHGVPVIDNEPMGADEQDGSVTGKQRWNDPALFFTLGALDRAFGLGGVHHSQSGLMAELPGPVQRTCEAAYLRGQASVESALPGVNGSYKNVGHAGSPLLSARFSDTGEGVVRAYSFIRGAQGVTVVIGQSGDPGFQWGNGWAERRPVATMTGQDGRTVSVLEVWRP